jgi:prepilin-type N-terminal cleavage/methylation domain-containing protein
MRVIPSKSQKHIAQHGFTIVELIVVVVVIGILAAITIVSYNGINQRAIVASLQSDLDNAAKLLKLDQVDIGSYPSSLSAANNGKGISASSGTTLQYQVDNTTSPPSFCITATKVTTSYKITDSSPPTAGVCLNYGLALNLDAGNAASYPGSGTTWTDISGNNNNGSFVNTITYDSNNGGSLVFNGSGYISLPNFINQANTNQEWTVNASVKLVSTTPSANNQQLLNFNSGVELAHSGTNRMLLYLNSGTNDYYNYGNFNLKDGLWHIVSFVFQNSTGKKQIFVDNIDVTITSGPNRTSTPSGIPNPLQIGPGTIGEIGYLSVYNRALTATEVQQIFNSLRGRYGI